MGVPAIAWRPVAVVLALCAAALSLYLAALALLTGRLPPGCGEGSGCGDVLTSAWARLFGIPVSLPAIGMYIALATLTCLSARIPAARRWVILCAACILTAVVWFIVLQAVVLRAFCVYCMVDHTLGALAAVAALAGCVREEDRIPWGPAAAGLALTGLMVTAQVLQPHTPYRLNLPAGNDFDVPYPGGRYLGLRDGSFQLRLEEEPVLGDLQAERALVLMVDYACLHCRHLHHLTRELLDADPGRVVVTVLPTPIHPDCNPLITSLPDPRFEESCELARCSLAVFVAAPDQWPAFDAWMFASERHRSQEEAFEHARALVGPNALDQALAGDRVKEMLRRNVSAWGDIPVQHEGERRVPVAWTPGQAPIVGPVDAVSALETFLEGPAPDNGPDQ